MRNLEVDVLQVVDARSAYRDAVVRHSPGNRRQPGRAAHPMRPAYRLLQREPPKLLIIAVCRGRCRGQGEQSANKGEKSGQQSDGVRSPQEINCLMREKAKRKEPVHNYPRLVTSQRW